ncbi:hypothetical protein C8R46DRAFT_1302657, partial [Mycena filopes]
WGRKLSTSRQASYDPRAERPSVAFDSRNARGQAPVIPSSLAGGVCAGPWVLPVHQSRKARPSSLSARTEVEASGGWRRRVRIEKLMASPKKATRAISSCLSPPSSCSPSRAMSSTTTTTTTTTMSKPRTAAYTPSPSLAMATAPLPATPSTSTSTNSTSAAIPSTTTENDTSHTRHARSLRRLLILHSHSQRQPRRGEQAPTDGDEELLAPLWEKSSKKSSTETTTPSRRCCPVAEAEVACSRGQAMAVDGLVGCRMIRSASRRFLHPALPRGILAHRRVLNPPRFLNSPPSSSPTAVVQLTAQSPSISRLAPSQS